MDSLNNSNSKEVSISSEARLINIKSDGKGIAIGKFSETTNLFDINMPTKFRDTVTFSCPLVNLGIYPIGAIYISTVSTSPASLFGGTLVQIMDRFLLSAGSGYSAGDTGGSASLQAHTHSLNAHTHSIPSLDGTTAWVGAHTHDVIGLSGSRSGAGSCVESFGSAPLATRTVPGAAAAGGHSHYVTTNASTTGGNSGNTSSTGSGNSENMPPYLVVYMWKRTA